MRTVQTGMEMNIKWLELVGVGCVWIILLPTCHKSPLSPMRLLLAAAPTTASDGCCGWIKAGINAVSIILMVTSLPSLLDLFECRNQNLLAPLSYLLSVQTYRRYLFTGHAPPPGVWTGLLGSVTAPHTSIHRLQGSPAC